MRQRAGRPQLLRTAESALGRRRQASLKSHFKTTILAVLRKNEDDAKYRDDANIINETQERTGLAFDSHEHRSTIVCGFFRSHLM